MEKTTLFICSKNQIVRLPESAAMPKDVRRVEIVVFGSARIITPVGKSWDSWFDGDDVSSDFMTPREQS
ncbi:MULTISPECIES: type II toxin-antitoxin system VapB family antitoxin [unclassified Pseudomonas]|uniref:type II toxin-antitoxin system VapB family antitoxin n=1 Tax=unclassified Pseudomonas TaxID=196821 RepID=UPI001CBBEF27|nr:MULTISPECIES: type II toxin-antitoxin system VapB family antitoxin [unclassified Pseudomonas]